MNWLVRDPFEIWRWVLAIACTMYAIVITVRWLWSWLVYLDEPARERAILRRYIMLHVLRLRSGRFRGELLRIVAYSAAIVIVWWLHEH